MNFILVSYCCPLWLIISKCVEVITENCLTLNCFNTKFALRFTSVWVIGKLWAVLGIQGKISQEVSLEMLWIIF